MDTGRDSTVPAELSADVAGVSTAPVVSVVIPTYNRSGLTHRAVNSVRTTHPADVEIIVADDCGSEIYSYPFAKNPDGVAVTVVRLDVNGGPGLARSVAVGRARGRLVAFLDSDDEFDPGWIDSLIGELSRKEHSAEDTFFIAGKADTPSIIVRLMDAMLFFIPSAWRLTFMRVAFAFSNSFHTPSVAISRVACAFSRTLRHCEDYYTNAFAIYRVSKFIYLDVPACALSRRQGTVGGESALKARMFRGELSVRRSLFLSNAVPMRYKAFMPFGALYQIVRDAAMITIRRVMARLRRLRASW